MVWDRFIFYSIIIIKTYIYIVTFHSGSYLYWWIIEDSPDVRFYSTDEMEMEREWKEISEYYLTFLMFDYRVRISGVLLLVITLECDCQMVEMQVGGGKGSSVREAFKWQWLVMLNIEKLWILAMSRLCLCIVQILLTIHIKSIFGLWAVLA